jgi:hypothetical protein
MRLAGADHTALSLWYGSFDLTVNDHDPAWAVLDAFLERVAGAFQAADEATRRTLPRVARHAVQERRRLRRVRRERRRLKKQADREQG